tara:strand:- start:388 stop:840 length:453 start_codon:yes stop_codon:yes gene_type:complete
MNLKKNLIAFFIFFSILILSIINIKNPEKTKFYLFTSEIKEISLGNLIAITFLSGFTFSSLLTLISKNNLHEALTENTFNDEEIYKSDENNFRQELNFDRPPERDVRETQPTISVNYRFVDQDNSSSSSKNINNNSNKESNDWESRDDEW